MTRTIINAYAIRHPGGEAEAFSYERQLGKSEVLVKISHCSIAKGDVQFIDNDWGDTKYPLVPGHEIVGEIEDIGSSVTGLAVGDRVGIGYQQSACFSCEFCSQGNEQFCSQQKVIGVDCYGGAAEHIAVDGRFAFKIPRALDSAKSTPLLSSGLTVYSAIVRAGLTGTSEAAVLGIGGLGHLAIQFLRELGHKVSAFSHSPAKKEMIEQSGASYVDGCRRESLTALTGKFDFMLSTLNVSFDLNVYLRMLRPQGKFCFVAQPLDPLPIKVGLLYDNAQRTIYGNYVGSRNDMVAMLDFAADHQIDSLIDTMPFTSMNEAIDVVRRRNAPTRLVLQR